MRVVAGLIGGLRLVAPDGRDTRPTNDRVREATFNALGSLDVLDGAKVLDLFAGSGALGIEALSRGAAHCTFVEKDRRALAAVRTNLTTCGLGNEVATVIAGDSLRFVAGLDRSQSHAPPLAGAEIDNDGAPVRGFDVVLLDPPYSFTGWDRLAASLPSGPNGIVAVIESDRPIPMAAPWAVVRQKQYGTTLVTLVQRPAPESSH